MWYLGMTARGRTRRAGGPATVEGVTSALLTRRLRPVDLYAVDAVLAVLVALLCVYAARATPPGGGLDEPVPASVLVGLIIGLPVAVRRRRPRLVAVTVTVAASAALSTGVIPSFAAVAPACAMILAFYSLAVSAPNRQSLWIAVGCEVLIGGALTGAGLVWATPDPSLDAWSADPWSTAGAVGYALLIISPAFLVGYTVGERRAHAERLGKQLMRQAATEERLRVARELHDVVAHTMTLIVVKAAVGNLVADANPQEARDALRVIEATGRGAMLEVRRALDVLREDTVYGPSPGLDDLPGLADQATIGGVDVRVDVRRHEAADGGVPDEVSLAAYRIVQEAVTNVVKHAAPATCHATVVVGPDEISIEVTDDGRRAAQTDGAQTDGAQTDGAQTDGAQPTAAQTNGAGHGLIGMRERVGLHGGVFAAGPRPGGGFAVTARLPYGGGG
jgi:signal transduction histidine kinase